MKFSFILTLFLSVFTLATAQSAYKGKGGTVKFFSEATLEDIEAVSRKSSSVLNEVTGQVAVLIPVKSFEFRKKLMQEHFNENYMESEKYPDVTFTGKVEGLQKFVRGKTQVVTVVGILGVHGVSKRREIKVTLFLDENGTLRASGSFPVRLEDHKIKIPSFLFNNIAEEVEVSFELNLTR